MNTTTPGFIVHIDGAASLTEDEIVHAETDIEALLSETLVESDLDYMDEWNPTVAARYTK